MDLMVIIETMIKLLLLMGLGFALNKWGIFNRESNRMLSDLIVKVTTPLLIISSVCENDDGGDRLSILPVLGGAFVLYIALIVVGELLARLPFFRKDEQGPNACMLVFSNNSFMGIPVLESLYGSSSIFYNSIVNFPFFIFIFTYGAFRLSSGKQKFNIKSILTPGVISALVALVIFMTGIKLPEIVVDTCDMVGGVTSPLSMMVLGSTVAMYPLARSLRDWRSYLFSAFRLLVLPALALVACRLLQISDYYTGIVTLSCAMPVASMVLMLAEQNNLETAQISRTTLVSTLLSVVTIPLFVALLSI